MNIGTKADYGSKKWKTSREVANEGMGMWWKSVASALVVTYGDCSGMQPIFALHTKRNSKHTKDRLVKLLDGFSLLSLKLPQLQPAFDNLQIKPRSFTLKGT